MSEDITVRVAEANHRDAGRGIARLPNALMQIIDARSGDIIEIKNKKDLEITKKLAAIKMAN